MPKTTVNLAEDNLYDALRRYFQDLAQRAENGRVHIPTSDILWERNRHALLGYYLHPMITDTALHTMQLFLNVIKDHGGMHRHQGGVVIYVIEGKGYTIADGDRVDWEAGDLILLPIKPGGVAHQHVNEDPDKATRWLAFISNSFREHSGYEIVQLINSSEWSEGKEGGTQEKFNQSFVKGSMPTTRHQTGGPGARTFLDELFVMRDEFRERALRGLKVVKERDLPWEQNAQGKMKWYVHPRKPDTCTKTFLLYQQEIPPGGHSGKQRVPGGIAHVVLSGRMAAEVDGKRYECGELDCIALPIKNEGVVYQFFNPDADRPCRFIAGCPNFFDVMGVDMAAEFEQLETALP